MRRTSGSGINARSIVWTLLLVRQARALSWQGDKVTGHANCQSPELDVWMFCMSHTLVAEKYNSTAIFNQAKTACFPGLEDAAGHCRVQQSSLHRCRLCAFAVYKLMALFVLQQGCR